MRKRDLIALLKKTRSDLVSQSGGIFSQYATAQQRERRRLELLHDVERLLPEIIEKMGTQ